MISEVNLSKNTQIKKYKSISSTNDEAKCLILDGSVSTADDVVILAEEQTAGRGRYDRTWISQKGNLFFSLIFYEDQALHETFPQLSFIAALAIRESVVAVLPDSCTVELKWPNDVLVNGKKIAGILLEAVPLQAEKKVAMVVGVGVNIRHHPEGEMLNASTSLNDEGDDNANSEEILSIFLSSFQKWRAIWEDGGFAAIREEWLLYATNIGNKITVKMIKEEFAGIFKTIDEEGALVVSTASGEDRVISAGEIFFHSKGKSG